MARVIQGNIKYLKAPIGLSKKETYPVSVIGTSFHLIEIQISKTNPVTKVGSEVPKRTNTELNVSGVLPRNLAAKIPSVTPTSIQIIRAPRARVIVIGSESFRRSVTQAFSLKE
jgi:hypothetical protein